MKRFKFVNNSFKRKESLVDWGECSLWWNRLCNSGPWYLRKVKYKDKEEWLMGVDNGDRGGGGRCLKDLNDTIKEEVLKEFEPI